MLVDVAFTPAERVSAPVAVVVDVLRATSTMAQALAAGTPDPVLRGEGFDVDASPREFLEARAEMHGRDGG